MPVIYKIYGEIIFKYYRVDYFLRPTLESNYKAKYEYFLTLETSQEFKANDYLQLGSKEVQILRVVRTVNPDEKLLYTDFRVKVIEDIESRKKAVAYIKNWEEERKQVYYEEFAKSEKSFWKRLFK